MAQLIQMILFINLKNKKKLDFNIKEVVYWLQYIMETNMIKTSYATILSAICMIFLTWSFTKLTEKTWAENKMLRERISELETKCG